jgi:hypothetical protein
VSQPACQSTFYLLNSSLLHPLPHTSGRSEVYTKGGSRMPLVVLLKQSAEEKFRGSREWCRKLSAAAERKVCLCGHRGAKFVLRNAHRSLRKLRQNVMGTVLNFIFCYTRVDMAVERWGKSFICSWPQELPRLLEKTLLNTLTTLLPAATAWPNCVVHFSSHSSVVMEDAGGEFVWVKMEAGRKTCDASGGQIAQGAIAHRLHTVHTQPFWKIHNSQLITPKERW